MSGARFSLHLGCGLDYLESLPRHGVHAIVTDPPYGWREYVRGQTGTASGAWRQPPVLDGCKRAPMPRFSDLSAADLTALAAVMQRFARAAYRVLPPGGHVLLASTPLLQHIPADALASAGFERRGCVQRLVSTLRGGDRPKGAEAEFPGVCCLPRGRFEPWVLARKPLEGTVATTLRKYGTGALRRTEEGLPFEDVIGGALFPTTRERALARHPSLKPQGFMRPVVRAMLPLGKGVVCDPFTGGGATLAACERVGYDSLGAELDPVYHAMALAAIVPLSRL